MTGTEHKPGAEDAADEGTRRSGTTARDSRLLNRILELYALTEGSRSHSDTESFGLVLERMAYGAGVEERAELANRLAPTPDAPLRLMRRFAFDTILVARPVLQYSPQLSDKDLTVLASKLEQEHLLAIAHRLSLAVAVTDILTERGDTRVLATVLNNCGAAFSAAGRMRLAERARMDSELQQTLRLRPELAPGLLDRLRRLFAAPPPIAAAAPEPEIGAPGEANEAVEAAGTGGESPSDAAADAREPEISETAEAGNTLFEDIAEIAPEHVAEQIVAAAAANGLEADDEETEASGEENISPGSESSGGPPPDDPQPGYASEKNLIAVARAGLVPDTVTSLARLAQIEEPIVRHCLMQAELSALLVLCKATPLANTTFAALLKLRGTNTGESIDTVAMLKRYEAMKPHTAKRIIQFAEKKKRDGATAAAAAE